MFTSEGFLLIPVIIRAPEIAQKNHQLRLTIILLPKMCSEIDFATFNKMFPKDTLFRAYIPDTLKLATELQIFGMKFDSLYVMRRIPPKIRGNLRFEVTRIYDGNRFEIEGDMIWDNRKFFVGATLVNDKHNFQFFFECLAYYDRPKAPDVLATIRIFENGGLEGLYFVSRKLFQQTFII